MGRKQQEKVSAGQQLCILFNGRCTMEDLFSQAITVIMFTSRVAGF